MQFRSRKPHYKIKNRDLRVVADRIDAMSPDVRGELLALGVGMACLVT